MYFPTFGKDIKTFTIMVDDKPGSYSATSTYKKKRNPRKGKGNNAGSLSVKEVKDILKQRRKHDSH